MREYGYTGYGPTAENAMCGYVEPQDTVDGWMNSAPHRANLLNPDLREAGAGYHRDAAGEGYVVLDLASDRDYAPVIINDEALVTNSPQVRLYLHDQDAGDGWSTVGATVAVMISNTPNFEGAQWEAYAAEKEWTLSPGEGWRSVYVKSRDRLGQTTVVHDAIYLGERAADDQLALEYATQVDSSVTIENIEAGSYSHVQFSINWLADDTDEHFELLDGRGERANDAAAIGGSALRLIGGSGSTQAWSWGVNPFGALGAVAYFRLKIADNNASQEAITISINDGTNEVASRRIAAREFAAAGQYQEFAVPFVPSSETNGLLVFYVRRSSAVEVLWDATSLYSWPVPVANPYTYTAPNGYYRSSGVQVRLVTPSADGKTLTSFGPALTAYPHLKRIVDDGRQKAPQLRLSPTSLRFATASENKAPPVAMVDLTCASCGSITWQVSSNVPWLTASVLEGKLHVAADPRGLSAGVHNGIITLAVAGRPDIAAITLPVSLQIGDPKALFPDHLYLPVLATR
jgi:hypothetical protein